MAGGKREKPEPTIPWTIEFFQRHRQDDPARSVPAKIFLDGCPGGVRGHFLAVLTAVAVAPPPQFSGGGKWEAMHGDMKGYYEVRVTGPDRRQYRLFCFLEREAPGLAGPSIILVSGMSKPIGRTFSAADYETVRRLGDEYKSRSPRCVER